MLSVLANRTYRHLFAAQVIALIGTGMMTVALGLLAFKIAGDKAGAVLGTALAIKMIAYVGIAPMVGGFANFLPRRAFLVSMDIVRAGRQSTQRPKIFAQLPVLTPTVSASADVRFVDDGREGISLTYFELWDQWELRFRKAVPAHPGADQATAEVLLDLAIAQTRWRFRSLFFPHPSKQ
jgi:hypothetical protein